MKTFVLLTLLTQFLFVAANYGEWQAWSECQCGETQYRRRSCGSPPCTGPSQESRPCLPRGVLPDLCKRVCYGAGCSMGYVLDPCLDSCFYHCVKVDGLWTATRQCCNPCERWDRQLLTCVRNSSDPECTFNPSTSAPGVCPMTPGSSKTKFVVGGIEMSCGQNTEFNPSACACVHDQSALPFQSVISCITFDQPRPYGAVGQAYVAVYGVEIETNTTVCNVRGNCGYFSSRKKAHLEIPFFAGNQFSQFAFSFWYRRTPEVLGSMGLVCNGNSDSDSTIKLISMQDYNCGGFATEDMPYQGKDGMGAPDGEWHMYTMSYDGKRVFYYLDNVYTYNVSMTGNTIMRQCPMTIGSFLNYEYFDGYMDSISFFRSALTEANVQSLYDSGGACSPE